jgi:hypothetical protein
MTCAAPAKALVRADVAQGTLHGSPGRSGGSIIVSVAGSVRLTPSGLFLTLKPCRKQKTIKLTNPIRSRIPIKVSNDMAQSSPDCPKKYNTVVFGTKANLAAVVRERCCNEPAVAHSRPPATLFDGRRPLAAWLSATAITLKLHATPLGRRDSRLRAFRIVDSAAGVTWRPSRPPASGVTGRPAVEGFSGACRPRRHLLRMKTEGQGRPARGPCIRSLGR